MGRALLRGDERPGQRHQLVPGWAALYDTTFYGQLSAGKLSEPTVASLPREPDIPIETAEAFAVSELTRIVLALDQIDEQALSDRFLRSMSRGAQDDPVRLALTTQLASEIERRHIAVRNAKRAVSIGPPLIQASYPILHCPGPRRFPRRRCCWP